MKQYLCIMDDYDILIVTLNEYMSDYRGCEIMFEGTFESCKQYVINFENQMDEVYG